MQRTALRAAADAGRYLDMARACVGPSSRCRRFTYPALG